MHLYLIAAEGETWSAARASPEQLSSNLCRFKGPSPGGCDSIKLSSPGPPRRLRLGGRGRRISRPSIKAADDGEIMHTRQGTDTQHLISKHNLSALLGSQFVFLAFYLILRWVWVGAFVIGVYLIAVRLHALTPILWNERTDRWFHLWPKW